MNEDFYEPSDDTYTLIDILTNEKDSILNSPHNILVEIGCGAGLISKYLQETYKDSLIISTDINIKALQHAIKNSNTNNTCIKSNLLVNLRQDLIDILVFNPPYVETLDEEIVFTDIRASYSGGVNGRRIIDRFIEELDGVKVVYLLVIRVNRPYDVMRNLDVKGYEARIIRFKKIMGESIYIIKATKK